MKKLSSQTTRNSGLLHPAESPNFSTQPTRVQLIDILDSNSMAKILLILCIFEISFIVVTFFGPLLVSVDSKDFFFQNSKSTQNIRMAIQDLTENNYFLIMKAQLLRTAENENKIPVDFRIFVRYIKNNSIFKNETFNQKISFNFGPSRASDSSILLFRKIQDFDKLLLSANFKVDFFSYNGIRFQWVYLNPDACNFFLLFINSLTICSLYFIVVYIFMYQKITIFFILLLLSFFSMNPFRIFQHGHNFDTHQNVEKTYYYQNPPNIERETNFDHIKTFENDKTFDQIENMKNLENFFFFESKNDFKKNTNFIMNFIFCFGFFLTFERFVLLYLIVKKWNFFKAILAILFFMNYYYSESKSFASRIREPHMNSNSYFIMNIVNHVFFALVICFSIFVQKCTTTYVKSNRNTFYLFLISLSVVTTFLTQILFIIFGILERSLIPFISYISTHLLICFVLVYIHHLTSDKINSNGLAFHYFNSNNFDTII
ncbi:hypothetical protein TRFO_21326 [Tritrichomonas foetus]|uniref:Uncharacterized protein n=1 Tax=Tritrichomonas foetus TaxID=1144522 RepID=A0A1J4KE48_9EUKA|nr:hypothetical protein TRFO_21326 [Tritrichomonas foetus]|eukprot:OHT09703.1 hypothetical protein TRFO_21326 [Tritrichomonas foetus]